jgi:hypothetical protein
MNKLTENHFSFKCPMNWEEMEVLGSGRHCGKCRKHVFDLTNCSIDEVIALQRKHGPICGSIRVAQVAAVAISLSAAACQNIGSDRTTGTPMENVRSDRTMGKIRAPKEKCAGPFNVLGGVVLSPEQLEKSKSGTSDAHPFY